MKKSLPTIKLLQPNKPSKTKRKFRLLLDSAFAKTILFPKLSKKAHVIHSVHTLKLSAQAEDKDIYQKATQNNCCVVTIDEDFKKLVKPKKAGVILVPADLSVIQMEAVLVKFISGKNPEDFIGKWEKIEKD